MKTLLNRGRAEEKLEKFRDPNAACHFYENALDNQLNIERAKRDAELCKRAQITPIVETRERSLRYASASTGSTGSVGHYENVGDPICGLLQASFNPARQAGLSKIRSFCGIRNKPGSVVPQNTHSIRKDAPYVYPELDRTSERDPPPHVTVAASGDGATRLFSERDCAAGLMAQQVKHSKLPTSSDVQRVIEQKNHEIFPRLRFDLNNQHDTTALGFIYSSSTQRAYNQTAAAEKDAHQHKQQQSTSIMDRPAWPPTHTLEATADPINRPVGYYDTHPPASAWKNASSSASDLRRDPWWDSRPYTFCSHNPRGHQIPSYSGEIPAKPSIDLDNPKVTPFEPIAVARTQIPKFSTSSASGKIVGYTGHQSPYPVVAK